MTATLDDALRELRALAGRVAPYDPHNPNQCDCGGGLPWGDGHTEGCPRITKGQRVERLLSLLKLLDEQACAGELPGEWRPHHHNPEGFCHPGCPRWPKGQPEPGPDDGGFLEVVEPGAFGPHLPADVPLTDQPGGRRVGTAHVSADETGLTVSTTIPDPGTWTDISKLDDPGGP